MPGAAAVSGFEKSSARAVIFVVVFPRALTNFPHGGIDGIGIRGIDLDVGAARVVVLGNNFLPALSAVGGAIDAALLAGSVGMAEDGREDFVGIARIGGERGNLLAVGEAEMSPRLAGVGGLVNAVADGKVGTMQSLTTGDVDDVGIGGSDSDGADRLSGFAIEDGIPCPAVIIRFPDAAVDLTHVEDIGLTSNSGGGARASAAKRADHAPVQFLISSFGNLRPGYACR